jgi:hypothetical protein
MGVERHLIQEQECGRDGMARQPALQELAKLARAALAAKPCDDMGDQPDIAARLAARLDDAGAHRGMVGQRVLDLLELDTVAADLDLMVGAAEAFDGAVGAAAGEIAGPVQPAAWLARERIGDEALPALRGIVDIAAPDAGARDAELAGHADRLRLKVLIEDMELGIGQRRPHRDVGRGHRRCLGEAMQGDVIGTFRRAIGIDQRHLRAAGEPGAAEVDRQRLAGRNQHTQPREGAPDLCLVHAIEDDAQQ